ncbi:Mu-like prophage major head subunit gpT family protein [Geobacter pelophilus]|uniref:Mu-like prophage major head subunit gpT family protein n=1 Tax=Geoanaerobacter pelophilus TaxID=60036 RepID=A0AAW4L127_9BACT|nr:Mu-like prophage major head subunit gpT family protein [Geoanaerobacter pelophilus]MBT0664774.1 Mu-like prophage major head subunit gpT family protein [Geoanaerobacter pelophilus]
MKRFALFLSWAVLLVIAVLLNGHTAHAGDTMPLIGFGGLIINAATLNNVFTNIKTTFNRAFDAAQSQWRQTAMVVPSTGKQNDYSWLSTFPRMRKWVGDKVVKALSAFKYTIVNDDWEATVEVDRNDIEDDNLGIYAPQAESAGFSAKQLPDEIIADLKNASFTSLCYDGQYFHDTDHPVGDGAGGNNSISNKGTKALSNATLAAAQLSYGAARTAIMSFKDDEGRPLAIVPNVLEVPPALEAMANLLINSDKLNDNSPNPYKGTATVIVNPRLTSTTAWFLHCTNMPVKPFILQERKKPTFVQQTGMDSDEVFMRKKFKFGAEARYAGGYGLWQLSYGSDGTT